MNHLENPDIKIIEITPGYPILHIHNQHADARIALHGAHLTHYAPHGEAPIIFTSQSAIYKPGKAIRGGIPICWPWFGSHPAPRQKLPSHGYARTSFWELSEVSSTEEGTRLILTLPRQPEHSYPQLHASIEFFIGKSLELRLTTKNLGNQPETWSEALHSYFAVGDTSSTEVVGLDGHQYFDATASDPQKTINQQIGPVHFDREVDRIYENSDALTIRDTKKNRQILIQTHNSKNSIIWNPGEEKGKALNDLHEEEITQFICAESGNVRENAITLPPQSSHTLTLKISVSPL